jgi:hypothetical protein
VSQFVVWGGCPATGIRTRFRRSCFHSGSSH